MIKNLMIIDREFFDHIDLHTRSLMSVILVVDKEEGTFEVWKNRYTGKQGEHFPLKNIKECIGAW